MLIQLSSLTPGVAAYNGWLGILRQAPQPFVPDICLAINTFLEGLLALPWLARPPDYLPPHPRSREVQLVRMLAIQQSSYHLMTRG